MIVNKEKMNCRKEDFDVLVDLKVKLKEDKEEDKYQDLARELDKYNTTDSALQKSVRIMSRVLETWGNLLSLKPQEKNHQVTLV